MYKDEVMEGEIYKKVYVAPKMNIVECHGPNLLSGSDTHLDLGDDDTTECDGCEFQ
jgi:hypothetical protein